MLYAGSSDPDQAVIDAGPNVFVAPGPASPTKFKKSQTDNVL